MIPRVSPIKAAQAGPLPLTEDQGGWRVVQSFGAGVEDRTGLVDLSHRPKALVQGPRVRELGLESPGQALWTGKAWVGRISRDEAVIFDLKGPIEQAWPHPGYHDMTDGWALVGVFGRNADAVMGRLISVDIERPEISGPVVLATLCHGMGLRIINPRGKTPGYLLACERSYGQSLYDACRHAGRHLGLTPAGTAQMRSWLASNGDPADAGDRP